MEILETSTIQKLESLLLVAVPRDLTDDDVLRLRRQVLQETRRHRSRWVLLDFSRVDICDSFFGRFIQSTAKMAGLMGANVAVSGLQDAVVETMLELGMTLSNIHAVLDLDDALALSRAGQQNGTEEPFGFGQDEALDRLGQVVGGSTDRDTPYANLPFSDVTEL